MKLCRGCNTEKSLDEFGKNSSKKDGRQTQCKDCRNRYAASWYKDNSELHKQRVAPAKKRALDRNRAALWGILEEAICEDCGESDPLVLEFDHTNEKDAGVSTLHSGSLPRMLDEIKKCDIVCANCHRKRTYNRSGCWRIDISR